MSFFASLSDKFSFNAILLTLLGWIIIICFSKFKTHLSKTTPELMNKLSDSQGQCIIPYVQLIFPFCWLFGHFK